MKSLQVPEFAPAFCSLALPVALLACASTQQNLPSVKAQRRADRPAQQAPELDATKVLFAIRGSEVDVRKCFLRSAPRARGFVRLNWLIDQEGKAFDIKVDDSTFQAKPAVGCLIDGVKQFRFERAAHIQRATWTFVYRLEGTLAPRQSESRQRTRKTGDENRDEREDDPEQGLAIDPASSGHLEGRRIEGTIQAGFRLFAHCYRDGLNRDAALGGTIRFHFSVAPDGSVVRVENRGSDLPDQWVVDCIAEGFYALRFPPPDGGRVDALYRIVFGSD